MTTKNKARFAGFMAAAALLVGAGSASAAMTAAELQAAIAQLMAQLAALQGGTGGTITTTFTADLTIGSTGSQVVALQDYLVSKGYLVMPVGVAKGYFGPLTRAAVVKFQLANGISPAVGYFGPLTRGRLNAMLVNNNDNTGGGVIVVPGTGTEGQLDNDDQLGSIGNEDLQEGDDKAEVLGIEFDAEDSAMTIDRVDVDFEGTDIVSGGSDHLDHYVDSVSLWLDGKKLAEADAGDFDEDSNVYSIRFTGLNGVVAKDKTAELVVAVDVVSNVDGDDDGSEWTVTIPADGIRATDTKGISDTYFGDDYSETFTVGEATAGSATVTEGDNNPDAMDVEVDDEDNTDNVTMLTFDVEAEDQDITINEVTADITTAGANGASNVIKSLALYSGSTVLDTKNVAATTSNTTSVTFDDLDFTVDADDTETLTIKAIINDTEGSDFTSGDTASVSVDGADMDAEDEAGDGVSVDGDASGNTMTFRTVGLSADLTSITETDSNADGADTGTYVFKFKASAFGDDVYVSSTSTGAITYTVNGGSTTTASVILTSTADKNADAFEINEGSTEDFTFTAVLPGYNAFDTVEVTGIKWGTTPAGSTANTTTVEDWESDPLYLDNA